MNEELKEKIRIAAHEYATKMSSAPDKETPDWIELDFIAGVKWALERCAGDDLSATGNGEEEHH
jgi:hypothetical protein